MRIVDGFVLEALRRMRVFLDHNDETLAEVNRSVARKLLDESITRIETLAVEQLGGSRVSAGETLKQKNMRQSLRDDHMGPIATIAAEYLREQPEFTALRVPPWNTRKAALLVAARDMANAAEKHMEIFVQEGLSPNFAVELRAVVDTMDASIAVRGQSQADRVGATKGLKAASKRARARIKVLDSLVRRKLGTDDRLLREWQMAKHIKRARTSQAAASATDAPAPSAGTATTPSLTLSTGGA